MSSALSVWQPAAQWELRQRDVAEGLAWFTVVWVSLLCSGVLFALACLVFRLAVLLVAALRIGVWLSIGVFSSPFWSLWGLLAFPFGLFSQRVEAVPLGVVTDWCDQPVGEENGVAQAFRVPVTAHLCARVRPRAKWVRKLESVLGPVPSGTVGALVRGRWAPDLPSVSRAPDANLVLSIWRGGIKLLGGGAVAGRDGNNNVRVPYFVVEHLDGSVETVFPELISALSSYAWLRSRDGTLVLALRSRALEWCKLKSLSEASTLVAVASAVKWSWHLSDAELEARSQLDEDPEPPWWA